MHSLLVAPTLFSKTPHKKEFNLNLMIQLYKSPEPRLQLLCSEDPRSLRAKPLLGYLSSSELSHALQAYLLCKEQWALAHQESSKSPSIREATSAVRDSGGQPRKQRQECRSKVNSECCKGGDTPSRACQPVLTVLQTCPWSLWTPAGETLPKDICREVTGKQPRHSGCLGPQHPSWSGR